MRLLVACINCNHQYDATGHAIGTRFRCSCGTTLKVQEPQGHNAAVVRCSSCGASRGDGTNCQFCGSTFTLHERDLNTICPGCMSRISDSAKFCHSCGVLIAADSAGTEAADSDCPACGDVKLFSRQIGEEKLAILECHQCAGLWVGEQVFRHLELRAKQKIGDTMARQGPARSTPEALNRSGNTMVYRPCVVCGKLMNRQNYGRRSGVIIDRCGDHGIWFDNDELSTILGWIQEGGLDHSRKVEEEKQIARVKDRQMSAAFFEEQSDRLGKNKRYQDPFYGLAGALLKGLLD